MTPSGLRAVAADLLDLVVAVHCCGCAEAGSALCAACCTSGVPSTRELAGLGTVHAAADYDGVLRMALVRYKERGRRELARPLGAVLGGAVRAANPDGAPVVLVPIPSARVAARRRGGDHLRRLTSVTARRCGLPVAPALRPARSGVDSVGLTALQRHAAVRGTLAARPPPHRCPPALLLDDVVTTGATLTEAASVLSAAGWTVAGAAVLLSVPDPRGPRRA